MDRSSGEARAASRGGADSSSSEATTDSSSGEEAGWMDWCMPPLEATWRRGILVLSTLFFLSFPPEIIK